MSEPSPSEKALVVDRVAKTYGKDTAVDEVSFDVMRGEIFGLLGPNGAGKTSLIRMIVDILRPDRGSIRVFGAPMSKAARSRIGYLPEERGLYQEHRVFDVLTFLGELKSLPRGLAKERAKQFLARVHLEDAAHKRMRDLSKGMQQKLVLAAVLQHEPDLIVLDEPFIGLDPINREMVLDLVTEAVRRGAAVVLSTHLMDQVERLCTRALMVNRGRAVLSGTIASMRERFAENAVIVRCDVDLATIPEIAAVGAAGKATLRAGATPEQVLASLLARGAKIERFERALPSLNDVFLAMVKGGAT